MKKNFYLSSKIFGLIEAPRQIEHPPEIVEKAVRQNTPPKNSGFGSLYMSQ